MTGQDGQVFKLGASWGFRYYDGSGKRPQRSGFKTKGEARTALNEQLRRLRLGGLHRPTVTVGEIIDEFFATYVRTDKATVSWMEYHGRLIREGFGSARADELDAAAIGRWRRALPNEGSAHQTLGVFRQILGQAVKWGWIERNAAASVENPKPRRGEVSFFEAWPNVEAVALELGDQRDGGAVAILGAGTGLRPEEMFGLDWPDVDLSRRVLTVRRVFTKGSLKPYGKTEGSRRRVPLRARVCGALDALPGTRRGAVFVGELGARLHLNNWRRRDWDAAIEALGLPGPGKDGHLTPYALRHSYAAWSLAAGINIFTLAQRMGTSVQMVSQTYGHLADNAEDYERSILDAWDAAGGAQITTEEMDRVR